MYSHLIMINSVKYAKKNSVNYAKKKDRYIKLIL